MDDWSGGNTHEGSGSINLVAGQRYGIQLDFFEDTSSADVKLEWDSSNAQQVREIVPAADLWPPVPGLNRRPNITVVSVPLHGWVVTPGAELAFVTDFFQTPTPINFSRRPIGKSTH